MAEFKRTDNGIGYIICNFLEASIYCDTSDFICGECGKGFLGNDAMLIPYTNEIYHISCGEKLLKSMKRYKEEDKLRIERERNFVKWFKEHNRTITGVDNIIETQIKDKDKLILKKQENYNLRWLDYYIDYTKGFIAGGCFKNIFNGEKVKDIDIFFRSEEDFNIANEKLKKSKEWNEKYSNEKVVAYYKKDDINGVYIELIRKMFGTPEEIIKGFDFDITKFAYFKDSDNQYKCLLHKDFFEHLHLRRLVIDDRINYPIGTFQRILKYIKYGYGLCKDSKLKIIKSLSELNSSDINENNINSSLYDGID